MWGHPWKQLLSRWNAAGCMKPMEHSKEEYDKLIHRLNRIEGQIRGIRGMLEKSASCPDIIVQTSAVNAALKLIQQGAAGGLHPHLRHLRDAPGQRRGPSRS
jgi:DNA-binding FrmR family transcriptional regulator